MSCLVEPPKLAIDLGQVIDGPQCIRMLLAQNSFPRFQSTMYVVFRFVKFYLLYVETHTKLIPYHERSGMIRSKEMHPLLENMNQ